MKFRSIQFSVSKINEEALNRAKERQRQLAKPFGSLGRLEDLSAQVAGITGDLYPSLKKGMVVFCSDNGVFAEGVTPIGQDVTMLQATNMTMGKAGIGVLAAHANSKLLVVDIGMVHDSSSAAIIRRKIRRGTSNICEGPAMSEGECERAFEIGAEMAQKCYDQGIRLIGAGEMGVGNTTTSSSVLSALTGLPPEKITGKGAGLTDEAYENKINVIKRALDINCILGKHDSESVTPEDAVDIVQKVGGFDIAAMAGLFLRAAELKMIPVVDGFIAITAALIAAYIQPNVKDYLILSHRSMEAGYDQAAKIIGQRPLFDLNMRLGEGTGCPIAFDMIQAATRILRDMATFEECMIDDSVVVDNWEDEKEALME